MHATLHGSNCQGEIAKEYAYSNAMMNDLWHVEYHMRLSDRRSLVIKLDVQAIVGSARRA